MENEELERDHEASSYDKLASKFKELYVSGKERGREAMAAALESSREQLTALGELGEEQGKVMKAFLDRDLEQTITDAERLGEEAKVRLHPARLGAGALSSIASALEFTSSALHTLGKKAVEKLTYKTGELTSAGTLTCQSCDQEVQLKKTGRVPPCPKCRGVNFHKGY